MCLDGRTCLCVDTRRRHGGITLRHHRFPAPSNSNRRRRRTNRHRPRSAATPTSNRRISTGAHPRPPAPIRRRRRPITRGRTGTRRPCPNHHRAWRPCRRWRRLRIAGSASRPRRRTTTHSRRRAMGGPAPEHSFTRCPRRRRVGCTVRSRNSMGAGTHEIPLLLLAATVVCCALCLLYVGV